MHRNDRVLGADCEEDRARILLVRLKNAAANVCLPTQKRSALRVENMSKDQDGNG